MKAGSLDRRVALVRRGAAGDNGIEVTPGAWQRLGWRLASVKPVRRAEAEEGEARTGRRELSLWLRFDSLTRTLVASDALVLDGRLYELTAEPVEIGRREGIELIAVGASPAAAIDAAALAGWAG